jgi:hypothetical protein
MLRALTVFAITLAAGAAIAAAHAELFGIQLNGPGLSGIRQLDVVAPDASGIRVLTIRLPSGATLTTE